MRILNYPGYDHYKKIHEKLLHSVSDLQEKVATGKTAIGFELMYFLKTWLTKHIMEEEMQYTGFFLNAGAQAKLSKKSRIKRLWRS